MQTYCLLGDPIAHSLSPAMMNLSFQALGMARYAICFALLRKAVIVIPLTLLLPRLGLGVYGVFLAEPVSNALGGLCCFTTMYLTVYRKLGRSRE